MLGVYITINGVPIYARTAVRLREHGIGPGSSIYACDDGSRVSHKPKDGAVTLAKKLLDTIKEQMPMEEKP